ncbi:hypothetical protein SEVIR_9G344050v4 [Setaria viridis]|uniref:uncharacterized protein n=1 Tax=Setaria viridis TaxID=4556 RepID=UPI0014935504|nr:uncharacterized protein LOC117835622 [Setaria viridis]
MRHAGVGLTPSPSPSSSSLAAARSEVFRHVLSSDDEHCKAPAAAGDSISLPELSLLAMGTVVEHAEQVVFSAEYEEFAVRNAGLCVEITWALLVANMSATIASKEPCIEDVHRGA